MYGIGQCSRKDGRLEVNISEGLRNTRMEVMLAFKSILNDNVSTSQFVGSIRPDGSETMDIESVTKSQYFNPLSINSFLGFSRL